MKTRALGLLAGASFLAWTAPVYAQTARSAPDANVSEVVVTGTRIARDGYAAPSPVTVANVQQLQALTPSNIPDALNKLPSLLGSTSPTSATAAGHLPRTGNYLNLRAFGIPRSLILLDGRRVPAISFDNTVDINTLPQLLVDRVEVVTGGASAVYGSDAVTGVVNFILDKNFSGLKGVVQGGISDESDGKSYRVGMAGGGQILGDRTRYIWSVEHFQHDGLKRKEDRPLGSQILTMQGAGSAANPFRLVRDTRQSNTSFGGLALNGPFAGQQFLAGGVLGPFNPGTPTGIANITSGGDGAFSSEGTLQARLRTDQIFGRVEHEFSTELKAYAQVSFGESRTVHRLNTEQHAPSLQPLTIFSGNAFLRPEVQARLTAANAASFNIARFGSDLPRAEIDNLSTAQTLTLGLEGKFSGWSWEAYYTRGEGRLRIATRYNSNAPRFYAAVDAVRDPANGNTVCRVTLTNPGLFPGCVPLNLFGPNAASQAAINYYFGTTQFQAVNKLDNFAANVTGEFLSTWAGPVLWAFGGEYRAESLDQDSNAEPTTVPNFTGLRGGFRATELEWRTNVVASSRGDRNVWEVNGEVVVPLAKDLPLLQLLELNGAARYTEYSTSGSATTWKVGLNWQPIDDLRIRATRSRDIRAPSLNDLFAGRAVSATGFSDIHTVPPTSGITQLITGGNPDLVPEVAKTVTIGAIYSPNWLPGFALSLDYYDIYVEAGIGLVSGQNAVTQNECEASNGTSPLCALYIRPRPFSDRTAANFPTAVRSINLNAAETYTHGIDIEASYRFDLFEGKVDLRLLASHQPVLKSRSFASAPVTNAAGAGGALGAFPDKRLTFLARYERGPIAVSAQTRYVSSFKQNGNPALIFLEPDVPSVTYSDVNIQYKIRDTGFVAFLSIENVFDKNPPIFAETAVASVPGFRYPTPNQGDFMGRYFTSGFRFRF